MSDSVNDEINLEIDDETTEDELDIQVGEAPAEAAPEIVTMKPDELAALRAQADTARAVKEGIEGLASKFAQPQAQMPVNAPTETPEEFYAKHADEIFDAEKGPKILAQYNKMITEREYGPQLQAMSARIGMLTKENLKATDPNFKDYEAEVDALVQAQPANVRAMPDVYDRAWMTVRDKHRDEIAKKRADADVDARVEAKLKELGIDTTATARPPVVGQTAARAGGGSTTPARPVYRFKSNEDKARAEREAERRGLTMADYLRSEGRI